MTNDRNHFTKHGLHLNGLGKEVLAKQMVSHIYAIQDQKKYPPLILGWNSDPSHTDTLHQGRVTNRTSTRTVMSKLRPAGQTRPPERFYPGRDMIPNLTNERKEN
jgi:hypothetical protein